MQDLETSEEELIAAAQTNPENFGRIYDKYFTQIFRFILKRTNDTEISADLSQQVFLKAMLAIKTYEYRGLPFSAYLYRIAINECNEYFKSTRSTRFVSAEEEHLNRLIAEVHSEPKEDKTNLLKKTFEKLDPTEVQLLELRFFEMVSFREIGYMLDITENLAKVRTYRLLNKMKELMRHEK